ncbi:MAG: hypoxanthine-guanine phosphoribosyltransferase [Ectothiorhodospiraceae bacterium]|nr:hypoxanthine-guanine phosphoribosyltransferase [Ectothiorhodospiraceae bacterium]
MNRDDIAAALAAADRLYDDRQVEAALDRMAEEITAELRDTLPVVLCVMVGALIPAGRLLPKLEFPLEVDYVHATRYRGETAGGELVWLARPRTALKGRTVLIIDDILDEGHTLQGIIQDCYARGASTVRTAVLVKKLHDRCVSGVSAEYVGLTTEDRYVFGSGMDYRDMLRNVPGIYAAADD